MDIKERIFVIIQPDDGTSLASRLFDWAITALVLMSVGSVFMTTFDLSAPSLAMLKRFDLFVSLVFTIEYILRVWTADRLYPDLSPGKARLRFVTSWLAFVDLLAILPFWVPRIFGGSLFGIRGIRMIRLLRILKLNRYFDALSPICAVFRRKRKELIGSTFFVGLIMMVSSLLMYAAEHEAQPEAFKNAFSGLWWAVATLTTVGYGDICPITVVGRVLGVVIALAGVAALAVPTGIIASGFIERVEVGDFKSEVDVRADNDAAHDRQIAELRESLKRLSEQMDRLLAAKDGKS